MRAWRGRRGWRGWVAAPERLHQFEQVAVGVGEEGDPQQRGVRGEAGGWLLEWDAPRCQFGVGRVDILDFQS